MFQPNTRVNWSKTNSSQQKEKKREEKTKEKKREKTNTKKGFVFFSYSACNSKKCEIV